MNEATAEKFLVGLLRLSAATTIMTGAYIVSKAILNPIPPQATSDSDESDES